MPNPADNTLIPLLNVNVSVRSDFALTATGPRISEKILNLLKDGRSEILLDALTEDLVGLHQATPLLIASGSACDPTSFIWSLVKAKVSIDMLLNELTTPQGLKDFFPSSDPCPDLEGEAVLAAHLISMFHKVLPLFLRHGDTLSQSVNVTEQEKNRS